MKKSTLCILSTFFMLSVIPIQLKAETGVDPAIAIAKTKEPTRLNEIQAIESPVLSSSEKGDVLSEGSPLQNNQNRHGRKYNNGRPRRNVDVTITADNQGRHNHGAVYFGGGGLLILILILILVL